MGTDYRILITLGALLILSPLVKGVMERAGIPSLVGYILLGFLISVVDHQWPLVSPAFDNTFAVLAQLGVVALLFRVGLKSHTEALLAKLSDASLIWVGDVLTNLAVGFVVARYALSLSLETAMVIATAFSATSVAVSVGVWEEKGGLNTTRGQLLVDVAELDDLSGVLLLAVLLAIIPALHDGNGFLLPLVGTTILLVLFKLALFVTAAYLFSHYLEADFTRFSRELEGSNTELAITILGAGLTIAVVADYLGFSLAIGAMFAGLAFSRDPVAVQTDAKFTDLYEFLRPFFFIYIGMQVDPAVIGPSLGLAAVLIVPAMLAKFLGVAVPALRVVGRPDAVLLGLSMIPRAEIAMVIVYQCHQFGTAVVPDDIFAAMVVVAVGTSILAPLMLRFFLVVEPGDR